MGRSGPSIDSNALRTLLSARITQRDPNLVHPPNGLRKAMSAPAVAARTAQISASCSAKNVCT